MSYKEFRWLPDADHTKSVEPKVRSAQFGDGYEQRMRPGINTTPDTWKLNFTMNTQDASAIDEFLEEHAGAKAFMWKTPFGKTAKYKCESWDLRRVNGAICTISCEFKRVYE